MSYALYNQVNWVNSRLFVIRSQIDSLTPGPSFGHNLCFKCPNEKCEPILEIYVSKKFQWYKERHKPLSFDPWNCFLNFQESIETLSPKVRVALGMWGFTHSYLLTLSYTPKSVWHDSRASSCLDFWASSCLDSRASSCLDSWASSCLDSQTSSWPSTL